MYIGKNPMFRTNSNYSSSFKARINNDVKVSVIVPVYNQENYLKTALKSLENQTLKEAEFICINDGSKDKSEEILHDFADSNKRFKINKPRGNRGTGFTRNEGLEMATGKYIAFLDPDDSLREDALEKAYNTAMKRDCDMLVFDHQCTYEKPGKPSNPGLDVVAFIQDAFQKTDKSKKFNINENFSWRDIQAKVFQTLLLMSWNKIYKHELVENLRFSDCNLSEDNAFVFGAILNANKIGYLPECLYDYLQRDGSAVHTKSDKNAKYIDRAFEDVKKMLENMESSHKIKPQELKKQFEDYVTLILTLNAKILPEKQLTEISQKYLSEENQNVLRKRLKKSINFVS